METFSENISSLFFRLNNYLLDLHVKFLMGGNKVNDYRGIVRFTQIMTGFNIGRVEIRLKVFAFHFWRIFYNGCFFAIAHFCF